MQPPPLAGLRCLELAGLAPGPFAGMLLADYGASVLRVDRAHPQAHATAAPPPPTPDQLTRRKTSIAVNFKSTAGLALVRELVMNADVLIDPFRPGVLEKLGLGPEDVLLELNPRLIVARMTGFRRDGKYRDMAGHDINYIAVSGVLSMLGRRDERPYPPGNIIGDFAGGGAVCFMGILLALMQRNVSGKGQVVEANMVDGSAYMASFPRLAMRTPMWNSERGTNILDGGAPYYNTYETEDGKYVAVGALEPKFFAELLKGLRINPTAIGGNREDKSTWPTQFDLYTKAFKSKTRDEWEEVFDGTDACVTPVLTFPELEKAGFDQRPVVTLNASPGYAISGSATEVRRAAEGQGAGVEYGGWSSRGLRPGENGEETLSQWMGWARGEHYRVSEGGLERVETTRKAKL
ncbi:alpha-methylacyl-CoA racemase [Polychaeton citri CBS 116435]|uniref:Alpha-methylacyl-CoA racemase n=1 Tax=Polychaeton citri CBS 116435 TaxID=1314669 RepID=A0A9P4QDC5_9PEZI|nr:alpha-methylacyl-CoA racemase [Polychaeton citri CBS 116435]